MTRADKILILAVLAVGLLMYFVLPFFNQADLQKAEVLIKQEGQVVKTVPLTENESAIFTLQGKNGPFTVEVNGGSVRIVESSCPDKYCVKRGWISSAGETIICVPYEVIIYFNSRTSLDAITG